MMSVPGGAGPRSNQAARAPGSTRSRRWSAVKVFMNNDSPPITDRLSDLNRPPVVPVSTFIDASMLTERPLRPLLARR